jgi:hypothetical protein
MSDQNQFGTMALNGVVDSRDISLVPAYHSNYLLQNALAFIGALGALFLGVGLGPLLVPSTTVNERTMQVLAEQCAKSTSDCGALTLATPASSVCKLLVWIGIGLFVAPLIALVLLRPRKQKSRPPGATDTSTVSK